MYVAYTFCKAGITLRSQRNPTRNLDAAMLHRVFNDLPRPHMILVERMTYREYQQIPN